MSNKTLNTVIQILLGAAIILAIKSIFDNDSGKIISKEGSRILDDEDEFKKVYSNLNSTHSAEKVNQ